MVLRVENRSVDSLARESLHVLLEMRIFFFFVSFSVRFQNVGFFYRAKIAAGSAKTELPSQYDVHW